MGLTLIISKLPLFLYYTTKTPNIRSNSRKVLTSSGAKLPAFSWARFLPSGQTLSICLVGTFSRGLQAALSSLTWALPGLGQLLWAHSRVEESSQSIFTDTHHCLHLPSLRGPYTSHHTFRNTAKKKTPFLGPEHSCFPTFFPYLQAKRLICSPVSIQWPERSS